VNFANPFIDFEVPYDVPQTVLSIPSLNCREIPQSRRLCLAVSVLLRFPYLETLPRLVVHISEHLHNRVSARYFGLVVLHFELVKGELDPPSRVSGKALFEFVCICRTYLCFCVWQAAIHECPNFVEDATNTQSLLTKHSVEEPLLNFADAFVCVEAPHNLPQTIKSEAAVNFKNSLCRLLFHSITV
jgi:hypothetical protein